MELSLWACRRETEQELRQIVRHYLVGYLVRLRRQLNLFLEHIAVLLQLDRLLPVIEGAGDEDFTCLMGPGENFS